MWVSPVDFFFLCSILSHGRNWFFFLTDSHRQYVSIDRNARKFCWRVTLYKAQKEPPGLHTSFSWSFRFSRSWWEGQFTSQCSLLILAFSKRRASSLPSAFIYRWRTKVQGILTWLVEMPQRQAPNLFPLSYRSQHSFFLMQTKRNSSSIVIPSGHTSIHPSILVETNFWWRSRHLVHDSPPLKSW